MNAKFAGESQMARLALNKSLLKEYSTGTDSRVVYLNDGTEFQIQLYNFKRTKVGAMISINGSPIGALLVLRPGERVWLERFFDDNRKFLFSTYEVDGSGQTQEAISNNGVIEIKFYDEIAYRHISNPPLILYDGYNQYNGYDCTRYLAKDFTCTTAGATSISASSASRPKSISKFSSITTDSVKLGTNSCINHSVDVSDCVNTYFSSISEPEVLAMKEENIETGTIEKGSVSSQEFRNTEFNQAIYPFATERIHILPMSRKPFTSEDCFKKYCSECGRKLSRKFKFCPNCGAKI